MSRYGKLPLSISHESFKIIADEVFYYLYLPVSLADSNKVVLPKRLERFRVLIDAVKEDERWRFHDEYIYITAKRMFVSPQVTANRPGWHADGFGSNDLNYVWYDCLPTVFNHGTFFISGDHIKSLEEFDAQALPENDITYPCFDLLKLDPYVVHRVALADRQMMRTFIKISVSPNKYNLLGNSINHDLGYRWEYFERAVIRNDPTRAQQDYFKE